MSVIILEKIEVEKIANTLTKNRRVVEFVKDTQIAKDRKHYSFETTEETIGRALWYAHVANVTAYNLQYQENVQLEYKWADIDDQHETLEEAIEDLKMLKYNMHTNDGNIFLADVWADLIKDIIKIFERKETNVEYPNYIR